MYIVFVTSTLSSGGSERVMSLLANELVKRRHEVEIVNLNKHVVFYKLDELIKLSFAEDEVGSSIVKKCLWLRKHIKRDKPDIVIPFMEAVYCVTLLSLIGVNVPVLSSERIDPRKSPFFRNILRKVFLPLTTHLVVQTQDVKLFYPKFIQNKTSIIYNPVTESVYEKNCTNKEDIIVSVGKLFRQKNHKMLIEVFDEIKDDYPSYRLVIYGEGPLRCKLEKLIRKLQLEDRVLLPGRVDSIVKELNKAKLFCFTSNFEGMSNAIIEAICVGLPVVTTDVSGTKELIANGVGGYVVDIGDKKSFTCAVRKVLSNEARMEEMGNNNVKKSRMFELSHIVDKWELVINQIVKNEKK